MVPGRAALSLPPRPGAPRTARACDTHGPSVRQVPAGGRTRSGGGGEAAGAGGGLRSGCGSQLATRSRMTLNKGLNPRGLSLLL